MAIDDNEDYTLTGAQVKDLAARIKGAAGAVIYYVGETFFTDGATGESVYSDSALTTTVTATAMAAEAEAGKLLYLFELDSRNDVVSIHEISYVAPPGMDDGEFSVLYGTSIWDIFYVPGTGWSVNEQPIPTVNNATLTIQHNGTTVNTFTANASTNKTANVETIYADPIASSAAITPLVQTSMIADGAVTTDKLGASSVTPAKIDWSTVGNTSSGILRVVTRDAYRTVTQGTYTVFTDDASPVIPSGYTPIGLVGLEMSGAGYTSMTMTTHYISGNTITWCCQSPITWDTGIHFYWRILCVKTS